MRGGRSVLGSPAAARALAVAGALLLSACRVSTPHDGGGACATEASAPLAAPDDFHTQLADEVRDLGGGRIAWSTVWCLTWSAPSRATAFEVETLTCEGARRTLRRLPAPPLRIELARDENPAADGMPTRALQVALRAGELAFRVRALAGEQAGAWSPVIEVRG